MISETRAVYPIVYSLDKAYDSEVICGVLAEKVKARA
jgi:hypothetical protein